MTKLFFERYIFLGLLLLVTAWLVRGAFCGKR